ncbi:MAG: hypothetical protein ACPGU1_22275, partial [Myxococcota bacterium]
LSCDGQGECTPEFTTSACDDGDLCTVDDLCAQGVCEGAPVDCGGGECIAETGECETVDDCDDGDPCTTGTFDDITGTCIFTAVPCDDGDPCTHSDACVSEDGSCQGVTYTCFADDCAVGTCVGDGTCDVELLVEPTTHVWVGDDGAWEDVDNWDPPTLPCGSEHVVINVEGAEVTSDIPIAFLTLQVGGTTTSALTVSDSVAFPHDLVVDNGGTVIQDSEGALTLGDLHIAAAGQFTHSDTGARGVDLFTQGDVSVEGHVDTTGRGHEGVGATSMSGGSHAGIGGYSWTSTGATSASVHGDLLSPMDQGSHGNAAWGGTPGGGRIHIESLGDITVTGALLAEGSDAPSEHKAGGSGGSIWLQAKRLMGAGIVSAKGGNATHYGGGGGGGRVAFEATEDLFNGAVDISGGSAGGSGGPGTAGTWVRHMEQAVRFVFTQAPVSGKVTDTLGPFVVRLVDAAGEPVTIAGADLALELFTSSADGTFSASADFSETTDRVWFTVGSSEASFYYRDTLAATAVLTAGGPVSGGVVPAEAEVLMIHGPATQLAVASEPRTVPVNAASPHIVVERRDMYGNQAFVGELTVNLESEAVTGRFDHSAEGPFDGSVVEAIIVDGQSGVWVYYMDSVAAAPSLTASAAGVSSASQQILVVEGQNLKIWVGDDGPWTEPTSWDPAGVPNETNTAVINREGVSVTTDAPIIFGGLQVGGTVSSHLTVSGASGGSVTVGDGGRVTLSGSEPVEIDALTITSDGTITHTDNNPSGVTLDVAGDATIMGLIDAKGLGHAGDGAQGMAGGSHGGIGGYSWTGGVPPDSKVHGSILAPADLGSDGNAAWGGTSGGGRIRLMVGGALSLDGQLRADGEDAPSEHKAGGSGGSVHITANQWAGSGRISAVGGQAFHYGGGGGGGRIAIETHSGEFNGTVDAQGGPAGGSGSAGAVGTYIHNMDHAVRFDVIDAPTTALVNEASSAITIRLMDSDLAPVTVQGLPLVVELYTSTETGSFATDAGFGETVDRVTIPVGQSDAVFHYRDTTATIATLTIGGPITHGIAAADYDLTISAGVTDHLAIVSEPHTTPINVTSQAISVQRRDVFGNPVSVGDLQVTASTVTGTGRLDITPDGAFSSDTVTLTWTDGQSDTMVYLRDSVAGVVDVTITDPQAVLAAVVEPVLVVDGPDVKIWVGDSGDWADAASWSPPGVPAANNSTFINRRGVTVAATEAISVHSLQVGGTTHTALQLGDASAVAATVALYGTLVQRSGGLMDLGTFTVDEGGLVTHEPEAGIHAIVADDIHIAGLLDAQGLGNDGAGQTGMSGGSHGGIGGYSWTGSPAPHTAVHGHLLTPLDRGSAGNAAWGSTPGGGRVRLAAAGDFVLTGSVDVRGGDAPSEHKAGGSGGSVYVTAATLSGSGDVLASGGTATHYGGGGGGGRVAIEAQAGGFSGSVDVSGGSSGGSGSVGWPGTYALNMQDANRFEFKTAAQSMSVLDTSEAFTIALVDDSGQAVTVSGLPLSVELYSTTESGLFSATPGFSETTDRVVIPVGASSVQFYYRDTLSGVATLTAGGPIAGGILPGTQDITLAAGPGTQLVIATMSINVVEGGVSDALELVRHDVYGNPAINGDLEVLVTSTSPTGTFDLTEGGGFGAAQLTALILNGESQALWYYSDTTIGVFELQATDPTDTLSSGTRMVNVAPES